MAFSNTVTTLECGDEGTAVWDVDWPGDPAVCPRHGATTIRRISRCRDVSASRDFKLGVTGDVPEGSAGAAEDGSPAS